MQRFELTEGRTSVFTEAEFKAEWMLSLNGRFARELECEFPSPLNGQCYKIRSRDQVGIIPCGADAQLEINPKIGCRLLMQMLECAYAMPEISAEVTVGKIGEVYEHWAEYLAQQTLRKIKRGGLYWGYREREVVQQWIKGRLLFERSGVLGAPKCRYGEHTPDVRENQILASALGGLRHYRFERDRTRRAVNMAWRSLGGVEHRGMGPADCLDIHYHRLNQDYKPLHALCYSLLQQQSPAGMKGPAPMPAYTVHMPSLFERFCTQYIRVKLQEQVRVESQFHTRLKGGRGLAFRLDMALFSRRDGKPRAVVDAKYKMGGAPEEADVQQVVAYAVQLGVRRAFLVYPESHHNHRFEVGPVIVQTLGFDLGAQNIEQAGQLVCNQIGQVI